MWLSFVCVAKPVDDGRVNVTIVTDQADAVLAILQKKNSNQPIADSDWQRLFATEGYVRLKKREAAMQRSFADDEFKTFVLSDTLAQRGQLLSETLARWKTAHVTRSARLALAYLPKDARIRAKIYPEIKPRENSFVFDVDTDPAIFLYLDPKVSKEKFENTLAHELHHIGFGTACPSPQVQSEMSTLPASVKNALTYVGAFGEGFAMLAAAGGPDVHPHAVSLADERARWDKDMLNFNSDLKLVEQFFLDILDEKLNDQQRRERGSSFFGIQGPWYTVGWKMAVTIEKTYGRGKLIESMCDQRLLLSTYNSAAQKYNRKAKVPLALWSNSLIERLGGSRTR